jgi:hypothetical protein
MSRYALTPEEYRILTTTHFSLNNPSYYASLDHIPIDRIKLWLSHAVKLTPKVKKIATWINCVDVYKNLTDLTGIQLDLIPAHTYLDILTKASLINSVDITYTQAVSNLVDLLDSELPLEWDYYFILNYLKSYQSNESSLWLDVFKDLNTLTYRNKEYFYRMFYYLSLSKVEIEQLSNKSDLKLVKKCINTWAKLFKKEDPSKLISQLSNLLSIECNIYLVECICGTQSFYEVTNRATNINSKCEQILGVPIGTNFKKAKSKYLQLIKINHPDRHPDEFEYYSKKTAEINQAWKEWRDYNEF